MIMLKGCLCILFLQISGVLSIALGEKRMRVGKPLSVQNNVNQPIDIILPFKHILSVQTSDKAFNDILTFSPNRYRLHNTKQMSIKRQTNSNLLEQLRNPYVNRFTHLFRLDSHIVSFQLPNHFVIYKQSEYQFETSISFDIPELAKQQKIQFKVINQAYLAIFLSRQLVIVNAQHYVINDNIFGTEEVLFSSIGNNTSIALAYFNLSLAVVKLNLGKISLWRNITFTQNMSKIIKSTQLSVIRAESQSNTINKISLWLLDNKNGLYWMSISNEYLLIDELTLLYEQIGCYEMDVIMYSRQVQLLITCNIDNQVAFIRASSPNQNTQPKLQLTEPYFTSCNTKKYIFYNQNIISLQRESLDIYIPTLSKSSNSTFFKDQINLPLSSYFLYQQNEKLFVYSINQNSLLRQELVLQEYSLQIRSHEQVSGKLNLSVNYICEDRLGSARQICQYICEINISIHNSILMYVVLKSISIGLVILLVTTVAALLFICYKKYTRLQYMALQQLKSITNPSNFKL